MDVLITHVAGLDVHQATVRRPDTARPRHMVTETFGTETADLLALRDWLQAYAKVDFWTRRWYR